MFSTLNKNQLEALVELSILSIGDAHAIEKTGALDSLGVPEDDAYPLVLAGSFLSNSLSAKESVVEVQSLVQKKFELTSASSSGVADFMGKIRDREIEIKGARDRESLANATLPSFEHFRFSVDVRVKFNNSALSTFAPVVIGNLRTDVEDRQLQFQLSKAQLLRCIDEMQQALREMEEAEQWMRSKQNSEA